MINFVLQVSCIVTSLLETRDGHDARPARLIDLRECQRMDLLQAVYDCLLKVHFPVPGELDDLETLQDALQQPSDGLNPELHVLLLSETAEPMENLMGCASYEYYPRGNHCLISYICVAEPFRRRGVSKLLMSTLQKQMEERAAKPLAAIFAETHASDVEDGIMDPLERQEVLASLGFRCLDFDYVQPPLSDQHKPCGGLKLLVKDQDALPREAIVSYLDDFSGSVLGWKEESWKEDPWYQKQISSLPPLISARNQRPW